MRRLLARVRYDAATGGVKEVRRSSSVMMDYDESLSLIHI